MPPCNPLLRRFGSFRRLFILSILCALFLLLRPRWTNESEPRKSKRVQRVAILTAYSADYYYGKLKEHTLPIKQQYAQKHRYDLLVAPSDYLALPAEFANRTELDANDVPYYKRRNIKFSFLRDVLKTGKYDWVVWTDADHFFVNHSTSLDAALDKRWDLVLNSESPESTYYRVLNSGFLALQNTAWSLQLLDDLLDMSFRPCSDFPELKDAMFNSWLKLCNNGKYVLGDQGIFLAYYTVYKSQRCHIRYLPLRAHNSLWPCFGQGDSAVHFAGGLSSIVKLERTLETIEAFIRQTDFERGLVKLWEEEVLLEAAEALLDLVTCRGNRAGVEVQREMDLDNAPCVG